MIKLCLKFTSLEYHKSLRVGRHPFHTIGQRQFAPIRRTPPTPAHPTRGAPQSTVLESPTFIIAMNSPSILSAKAPLLRLGFFPGDPAPVAQRGGWGAMAATARQGPNVAASWAKQYFPEVNSTKTKYAFFVAENANPLLFAHNGTPFAMERPPTLLEITF
ncbi:Tbingi protein [Trypanosoma grayi]|uniref:Tbingi protein n=1 Tax=Trypanosoma grayi TaxID=71804 RepID=UPI0004F3F7C4|nr:Tbingi protein [Trypanosoma grayi]KEG05388.1 Tbingi protein [Trypanosoma grayi]